MLKDLFKTPFPWFGGKSQAAPAVWAALGDPCHYVEPFAGSMANLSKKEGKGNQQHRERLYLSPHCLTAEPVAVLPGSPSDLEARQVGMFEEEEP